MPTKEARADGAPFVAFAAMVPGLAMRLGVGVLRLKAKRRAGVRRFRRALVRGGMRPQHANQLAAEYELIGRLRTYLPSIGLRSLR